MPHRVVARLSLTRRLLALGPSADDSQYRVTIGRLHPIHRDQAVLPTRDRGDRVVDHVRHPMTPELRGRAAFRRTVRRFASRPPRFLAVRPRRGLNRQRKAAGARETRDAPVTPRACDATTRPPARPAGAPGRRAPREPLDHRLERLARPVLDQPRRYVPPLITCTSRFAAPPTPPPRTSPPDPPPPTAHQPARSPRPSALLTSARRRGVVRFTPEGLFSSRWWADTADGSRSAVRLNRRSGLLAPEEEA